MMPRITNVLLVMVLLCGTVLGCRTGQLRKEKKPVTDSWYVYVVRDDAVKPRGYLHLVRTESGDESAPVLISAEMRLNDSGDLLVVNTQTLCRDDQYLSPVKMSSEGNDEVFTYTAHVEEGKLTVVRAGGETVSELPQPTTTLFAIFEIVRSLPFEKREPLEFHYLAPDLQLVDVEVAYAGREEIKIGDQQRELHKFEHTQFLADEDYFLDEKHQLVRIDFWLARFELGTEEEAKRALKEAGEDEAD